MDTRWNKTLLLAAISLLLVLPAAVLSDPLSINFNQCNMSISQSDPTNISTLVTLQCCPTNVTDATVVNSGIPPPLSNTIRVRPAAQCTDAAYAQKLDRAYAMMKNLPADDPRSFEQQWRLHCSYCGQAFYVIDPTTNETKKVDIHFSWLFYPWHRWYLYFHERILQSLLGDPTFSLSYYNWDNPVNHSSTNGSCSTVGHNFPSAYSSNTSAAYNPNRSASAMGTRRTQYPFNIPDLQYLPIHNATGQDNANLTREELIYSNLGVMNGNLVTSATTGPVFMGKPYVLGAIGTPTPDNRLGGGGPLEAGAHASVHSWIGLEYPDNNDMGVLAFSARDPVFFSHHSNIDRLWQVWKDIGPGLNQSREYYNDSDFLNSSFLFYDENKTLWTVKISDSLDTTKLGYTYQPGYIDPWLNFIYSICSSLSYNDTITIAQGLPVPTRDANGSYHLEANSSNPLILLVTQPDVEGDTELFLTVNGISSNRSSNTGFDAYINWLDPQDYNQSASCRQYAGRFFHQALSESEIGSQETQQVWTRSISTVLDGVSVPAGQSPVAVTLLSLASDIAGAITFTNITISASSG